MVGRGIHGVAGSDHNPSIGQNISYPFVAEGLALAVRTMTQYAETGLLFVPPRSSGFRLVEQVFAKLQHLLRKARPRTHSDLQANVGTLKEKSKPDKCASYLVTLGNAAGQPECNPRKSPRPPNNRPHQLGFRNIESHMVELLRLVETKTFYIRELGKWCLCRLLVWRDGWLQSIWQGAF